MIRTPKRRLHEPQLNKVLKQSPSRKSGGDTPARLTPKKSEISEYEAGKWNLSHRRESKMKNKCYSLHFLFKILFRRRRRN